MTTTVESGRLRYRAPGQTLGCLTRHRIGFAAAIALLGFAGVASGGGADPPILVRWRAAGAIRLGESRQAVEQRYDANGHRYHVQVRGSGFTQGYYLLHRSRVYVRFNGG